MRLRLLVALVQPHFSIPETCLRVGSLAQTADARMFELPATESCGQYFDTGDVLCVGHKSLRIVRKWGLAVKLESSHGAAVNDSFTVGACSAEFGRLVFPIESISTVAALAFSPHKHKISVLLTSPDGNQAKLLTAAAGRDQLAGGQQVHVLPLDEFASAKDFTLGNDGVLLVCDTANHRIVTLIGNFVDVVAGNGVTTTALSPHGGASFSQLKFPTAVVAAFSASPRHYDALYILDSGNFRIVRWRFAALRAELVWQAPLAERPFITGFGKLALAQTGDQEPSLRLVVKKAGGDSVLTLTVVHSQPSLPVPAVLWTVDGSADSQDNIALQVAVSEQVFPEVHDLVVSANFVSSRAKATTWQLGHAAPAVPLAHVRGFVALAEGADGLFGVNDDGLVWAATNRSAPGLDARRTDPAPSLIRTEL